MIFSDETAKTSLVLVLPEPPSFNHMIGFAKERTKKLPSGGWSRRPVPVVYDRELKDYGLRCDAALRGIGIRPPMAPWPTWRLVAAHFQLHALRDPIELLASLKWPVDALVRLGFVLNDSPRELLEVPRPTQSLDRANRLIRLTIVAGDCVPATGLTTWPWIQD